MQSCTRVRPPATTTLQTMNMQSYYKTRVKGRFKLLRMRSRFKLVKIGSVPNKQFIRDGLTKIEIKLTFNNLLQNLDQIEENERLPCHWTPKLSGWIFVERAIWAYWKDGYDKHHASYQWAVSTSIIHHFLFVSTHHQIMIPIQQLKPWFT
jgi:hypothetical protein